MRDGFLRSSNFQRNAYGDTRLIYTLWSSMVKSICSSGFSLSGSRVPNSMPRVFFLSLSLLAGFPFRPTPTAGFRSSDSNRRVPTIDASTIRSTSSSFSNTWPLLSGFVGGEKGKNEIEKLFPLLRTIRRGYESRDFKPDRITRQLLLFTREEDWFYFSIGHEYRYAKCGNFLPVHPVNDHPRNLNNV